MKLKAELVNVTPALAEKWLTTIYEGQRKARKTKVEWLAEQIVRGEWKPTPDAIAFDEQSKMINGQHRCLAIMMAGKACLCVVLYDWPRSSFEVIDTQTPRTSGDVLGFIGVHSGKAIAAVATALLLYEKRAMPSRGGDSYPSRHQVLTYYTEHCKEIEQAYAYCGNAKIPFVTPTNLITGHVLFSRSDPARAKEFTEALITGENLNKQSPIGMLRNRLVQDRLSKSRLPKTYQFALMIKAFNAFKSGISVRFLKYAETEDFPLVDGA